MSTHNIDFHAEIRKKFIFIEKKVPYLELCTGLSFELSLMTGKRSHNRVVASY